MAYFEEGKKSELGNESEEHLVAGQMSEMGEFGAVEVQNLTETVHCSLEREGSTSFSPVPT